MFEVKTVAPGSYVYGRQGGYLGRVEAANEECIRIREAAPRSRVFYAPRSAIIGTLPGGELFLRCTLPELESIGWQHPPHGLEPS